MERLGLAYFKVLHQHLPRITEKNSGNLQSEYPISWTGFKIP
jgi:hypothetical protein